MDVIDQLNRLAAMVRAAKTMPMSASCVVNRADILEVLERLQAELPANLEHAQAVLSERDAVLAAGREHAERLLERARAQRELMVDESEVLVAARGRAAEVTGAARADAARLLTDADDYVDRRLAEFESFLDQLGLQVNNGRLRLTSRRAADRVRVLGTDEAVDRVADPAFG